MRREENQKRLEGTAGLLTGKRGKQETMEQYLDGLLGKGDGTDLDTDEYMETVKALSGKMFIAEPIDLEPDPSGHGIKFKVGVYVRGYGSLVMRVTLFNDAKNDLLLAHQCFGKDLRDPDFIVAVTDFLHGDNIVLFTGTPTISSNGKPYFKINGFKIKNIEIQMPTLRMFQDSEINRRVDKQLAVIRGVPQPDYCAEDREESYVAKPRTLADELPWSDDDGFGGP